MVIAGNKILLPENFTAELPASLVLAVKFADIYKYSLPWSLSQN
jgi:hypothetical protein